MRALILGGTRFIGARVVHRLVAQGHAVTVFHRGKTLPSASPLPVSVGGILGDRTRLVEHAEALRQLRPDVVVDMVAMTERDARGLVDVFGGSGARVVVASSEDVYRVRDRVCMAQPGPPEPVPLGEDAPLRELRFPYRAQATSPDDPRHDYDKIPVEELTVRELGATVLRLPAVYGPGDYQRRVFEYLKPMLEGKDVIPLDETLARWRWTRGFVEDVAHAIVLAATEPGAAGRVYNVGEADALCEAEWAESIGRAFGWGGRVVPTPRASLPPDLAQDAAKHDFTHDWSIDTRRIRRELGFCELGSRDAAMRETVAWEIAHLPVPAAGA